MKPDALLIVEDSDEDYEVTCWALRQAGVDRALIRAASADEAMAYLQLSRQSAADEQPVPCLVLLDLNLPGTDGRQFLLERGKLKSPAAVPIVVLSTSNNPRDINDCYRLGAAGYFCKPLELDDFVVLMRQLASYWFHAALLPGSDA